MAGAWMIISSLHHTLIMCSNEGRSAGRRAFPCHPHCCSTVLSHTFYTCPSTPPSPGTQLPIHPAVADRCIPWQSIGCHGHVHPLPCGLILSSLLQAGDEDSWTAFALEWLALGTLCAVLYFTLRMVRCQIRFNEHVAVTLGKSS